MLEPKPKPDPDDAKPTPEVPKEGDKTGGDKPTK